MPITMDAYRFPKFQKYQAPQPFTEDKKAKFAAVNNHQPLRRYRGDKMPQPGYNPNANSYNVKNINLDRDDFTLPAY